MSKKKRCSGDCVCICHALHALPDSTNPHPDMRCNNGNPIPHANRAQCHGKNVYGSNAEAAAVATRAVGKRDRTALLRTYYHHECGGWHLTSAPYRKDGAA